MSADPFLARCKPNALNTSKEFLVARTDTPLSMDTVTAPLPTRQLIREKIIDWLRKEAKLEIDWIDDDASLFNLGLDSLAVATIACELEQATNKRLNPDVVYELQTINEIAEYLDSLQVVPRLVAAPCANDLGRPDAVELPAPLPAAEVGSINNLEYYARLNRRVRSLKEQGLYFFEPEISQHDGAWVVADGKRMLMLGSYEYLGLLAHPHLKETAIAALEEFGTGHHGARLLAGTTTIHKKLEAKLAAFMQAEDAVVFSSGYVTNLATISTLIDRNGVVIGDQWNHASIVDGCRMSGAELLVFQHNDMDSLAEKLEMAAGRRTLVVVDSVFSMDGDIIDLPAVVDLCKKHGALLMVDEAHSLGVLGKTGRGVQEHFGLGPDDIDVKMGTLSKTLAGCGGFVAAREEITTYLRHHARGYIFTGALPAGQASVAIAALEVLEREPELVSRLWENVRHYMSGLHELGFDTAASETPIVPVMTRTDEITLAMTRLCRAEGLLVIPVCFPAVPMDSPRLAHLRFRDPQPGRTRLRLGRARADGARDGADSAVAGRLTRIIRGAGRPHMRSRLFAVAGNRSLRLGLTASHWTVALGDGSKQSSAATVPGDVLRDGAVLGPAHLGESRYCAVLARSAIREPAAAFARRVARRGRRAGHRRNSRRRAESQAGQPPLCLDGLRAGGDGRLGVVSCGRVAGSLFRVAPVGGHVCRRRPVSVGLVARGQLQLPHDHRAAVPCAAGERVPGHRGLFSARLGRFDDLRREILARGAVPAHPRRAGVRIGVGFLRAAVSPVRASRRLVVCGDHAVVCRGGDLVRVLGAVGCRLVVVARLAVGRLLGRSGFCGGRVLEHRVGIAGAEPSIDGAESESGSDRGGSDGRTAGQPGTILPWPCAGPTTVSGIGMC